MEFAKDSKVESAEEGSQVEFAPPKTLLRSTLLHEYILDTSVNPREPAVLKELRELTAKDAWHALATSPDVGQVLMLLLQLMNAKKTLEVGVYTGYSLLCTALALPHDGQVIALDKSRERYNIGAPVMKKAGVAHKIDFREGPALDSIDALHADETNHGTFDFIYVDADKNNYLNYHQLVMKLVRVGGVIAYDNTLWNGVLVSEPDDPFSKVESMVHAGTESSANTVVWAMSELMVNPDTRERAQEGLDAVVGSGRLVQESDIPNLPLLRAIIKETFRLHPAVPLSLPRCSTQPCIVAGCEFPANTRLVLNIFAIHRDPSVYENPDSFQPSRFLEHPEVDHMSGHSFYQLILFGVGRRMCPAYNLGNAMVTLMVANLVHRFDWSLPQGMSTENLDMGEVFKLVNLRKEPLSLIAKPRSPAYLY